MNSKLNLYADTLACALALTGKPTPTAAALATALGELYPAGNGPAVPELLAAGWLVPTIDGRGLRVPPLPLAEQDARLAAYEPSVIQVVKRDVGGLTGQGVRLAEAVPEGVLKLTTPPHAPPTGQDTRRPVFNSVNSTELAANSVISTELAAHATGPEFSPPEVKNPVGGKLPPPAPLFSYYRDGIATTTPYAAVTPLQLWTVLVSPRQRAQTEALRAAAVGSPERAELKKRLDYVTPAGTFTRRGNAGLVTASGLLVLDFDHLPDVAAARAALLADALLAPELVLVFVSPGGDGLKALVRVDPAAAHLDTFRAYAAYLGGHYAALGLVPDEAGKDVARACFVPYAPDAWLAPAYASLHHLDK